MKEYEYVALQYGDTLASWAQEYFNNRYNQFYAAGWKEFLRVPWPRHSPSGDGGVCVLRREYTVTETEESEVPGDGTDGAPTAWTEADMHLGRADTAQVKPDPPRNWTRWTQCGHVDRPRMFTEKEMLGHPMPDELKPRRWMEGEAEVLAQRIAGELTLWQLHASGWTEAQLVGVIQGALTEPMEELGVAGTIARDAEARRCEELQAAIDNTARACGAWLEAQNAKLQAAIDEVYATSKTPDVRGIKDMTLRAVRRCLRPLATKED